jgi:hypothetical protein
MRRNDLHCRLAVFAGLICASHGLLTPSEQCIVDALDGFEGSFSFDPQNPNFENTTDIDNRYF